MNSDLQEGKGGANIIPSARKSIHSHCDDKMVGYGLNKSKDKYNRANSPANHAEGRDEVDNVMSKMARQASPLSIRKKNINHTNSYSYDETTSEEDSNVLSKSLPSTLPSHLYYSENTDIEESNYSAASISKSRHEDNQHNSILGSSFDHQLRPNESNQGFDHLQRSPFQRKQSVASSQRHKRQPESNSVQYIMILTLVIGFIAVLYVKQPALSHFLQHSNHDKSIQTDHYDITFENNMNKLQEKYNIDSNIILQLKVGITTIFSKMTTGSFIFLYDSKTSNFNPTQLEKFINEVAFTAARYLRNDKSSIKHTVLSSSNLDMREHGELIQRYRDDVDKTGVLLVKEVDSVPSDLAMAFHYYCDEYDPLVKRSAIFFTLNVANCSNYSEKKSIHDFIEKCLAGKWKTVPSENMRPLLTRVVDGVLDVTSVF